MDQYPQSVRIVEVGPRDGLQNQPGPISTDIKVELIERLVDAGIKHIEAGAFVSPKWIPLMADSSAVMLSIKRRHGVVYSALTPNLQGMQAALKANANEVAVFVAASESFSQKNTNCSVATAIDRIRPIMALAQDINLPVRGYISTVMACPYEGDDISPHKVADLCKTLIDLGCHEISLGDTIGRGTPVKTRRLIATCADKVGVHKLAAHFHNTYGQALANLLAALSLGVAVIDSSVAGLGGCPYAKGTSGNVATEDVLFMLDGMGIDTGINLHKLVDTAIFIADAINIPMHSHTAHAIKNARA